MTRIEKQPKERKSAKVLVIGIIICNKVGELIKLKTLNMYLNLNVTVSMDRY